MTTGKPPRQSVSWVPLLAGIGILLTVWAIHPFATIKLAGWAGGLILGHALYRGYRELTDDG